LGTPSKVKTGEDDDAPTVRSTRLGKISTEVVALSPPLSVALAWISNHVVGPLSGTGAIVNEPAADPATGPREGWMGAAGWKITFHENAAPPRAPSSESVAVAE